MASSKKELKALKKDELIDRVLKLEKDLDLQRVSNALTVVDKNMTEEQLKIANNVKDSTEKMALLGEMSGNMAHEINNPLLVLNGYISKLKRYMEHGEEDRQKIDKAIERIDSMTKRIQFIIKGLLKFSRGESKSLDFGLTKVSSIIEDTVVLCDHKIKRAGITLTISDIPQELEVECAQIQISQVLLNLFSNAHDAIISLENPWITVEVYDLGETVKIQLTDCGKGIPLDTQKKLFERGFTTKAIGLGTGLGLALSKELISAHGGSLEIDNQCENTRFIILLPKVQAHRAS